MKKLLCLVPLLFLSLGCATAEHDTLIGELTLSSAVSLCYRTIDGVDKLKTDKIQAKIDAGDKAGAKADYSAYKPKIEKARGGCNTAADVAVNAEAEREKVPTGGDMKNYTAWLPTLTQAYAAVMQIIADVKGLVQ